MLGRGLLVRMDEGQKRAADESACLVFEVVGKHRVQVEKLEAGGEQGPVCGAEGRG